MYQLTQTSTVIRSDGAQIPDDPLNADRVGYVAWLAAGGVPDAADPIPGPTPAQQIEALERQYLMPRPVRDVLLPLMEAKAAELGYTPTQLRIANPGYRRVKELDEQIAALRAML